jgi:hypothetical protein
MRSPMRISSSGLFFRAVRAEAKAKQTHKLQILVVDEPGALGWDFAQSAYSAIEASAA